MNDGTNDFQLHAIVPKMQTERQDDDLDIVAWVKIALRRNGSMSLSGHLGDKQFVLAMLDNARDSAVRQLPDSGQLVVPSNDVAVPEFSPVKA